MLKQLKAILKIDIIPIALGVIIFASTLIMGYMLADFAEKQLLAQVNYQLRSTADYSVRITDPEILKGALASQDRHSEAYKAFVSPYSEILASRHDIETIYTLVKCPEGLCFISSQTAGNEHADTDMLLPYYKPTKTLNAVFKNQVAAIEPEPYSDEFGSFLSAYQPVFDTNGNFIAVLGVDMDARYYLSKVGKIKKDLYFGLMISSLFSMTVATAVYLMRRKMALSELRYKSLVNNIPAIVFECRLDEHLTMSFLNIEIERLAGCTPAQLVHNRDLSFLSLVHEDEREGLLQNIVRQITKHNLFDAEFRIIPHRSATGSVKRNRAAVWLKVRGIKVGEDYDGCPVIEGYMQDITSQKAAEAKIAENQRYIKDLADSMPNLLWVTNPYGDSVFYNKTWLDFSGRTLTQEIDDGWLSNIHPDDKDAVMNKFLRALSDEIAFECWFRIQRHDGAYRWMLANCTPKHNHKGDCDGFICVATDITDRKIFENEIKNANEQMQQVFLHAPASIAVFDKDLRYVLASERWKQNTINPNEDLIGRNLHETTSGHSQIWKEAFEAALNGVAVNCPVEKYIDPRGQETWFKVEVHPWLKNDQINGIMVFAENVTDSYRATEEIRRHRDNLQTLVDAQTKKLIEESEKNILLRTIIASANEAQDMDLALQSCIEEVCNYTGWDVGHCFLFDQEQDLLVSSGNINKATYDTYPNMVPALANINLSTTLHQCLPVRVLKNNAAGWQTPCKLAGVSPRAQTLIDSGLKMSIAFPITVNGQSIGVFEFFCVRVTEVDTALLGLLENIGVQFGRVIERFRQEEVLTKAKELAEASAKSKSEFLSNMSHELRTPMHAILNYASMSLKRIGNAMAEPSLVTADGRLEKYISNIQTSGNRLLELLNNLLDLAKMESGKMSYVFSQSSIHDIVERTTTELDSLLSAKQIQVLISGSDTLKRSSFDPQRMMQVCVNLFSNAIRFTPEKSTLCVALENVCDPQLGQAVHFSLTDEGPGIPENEVDSIFEIFTQSSKTKSGAGGTGLGLTIAKQIVEAHKGRIWAENTTSGARFNFILPLNPIQVEVCKSCIESGHSCRDDKGLAKSA